MYQFQDWLDDVTWFFSSQKELHESGHSGFPEGFLERHFETRYGSLSQFHMLRFDAAMRYLHSHIEQFNGGSNAIAGEHYAAAGRPLIKALYRIYAQCPDDMIHHDYSVDLVRKMASESEA